MTQSNTKQRTNFPKNVQLISTTRSVDSGASLACTFADGYAEFNLASHVGDDFDRVMKNREWLIAKYKLPSAPKYLEQIHSNICLDDSNSECIGDAVVTQKQGVVCMVMTADCLPIFASNEAGTQVGVAHAGWKGIVGGIIESFIDQFNNQPLIVHFGPAISQANFEVGSEVYQQFIDKEAALADAFITSKDKYLLDMYQAASIILTQLGVQNISGGNQCTYAQSRQYFSYRRDGSHSGRMANLIWIK